MYEWIDKYVEVDANPWAFPPFLLPFVVLRIFELKKRDRKTWIK